MKTIISGRRYDTETAEEVAKFWNGLSGNDFRSLSESLYRTKNGAYFLAGEGGPMTRYAQPCGDATGGGSCIFPLSDEEALEWLEGHGEMDAIEKYFAASIVDA